MPGIVVGYSRTAPLPPTACSRSAPRQRLPRSAPRFDRRPAPWLSVGGACARAATRSRSVTLTLPISGLFFVPFAASFPRTPPPSPARHCRRRRRDAAAVAAAMLPPSPPPLPLLALLTPPLIPDLTSCSSPLSPPYMSSLSSSALVLDPSSYHSHQTLIPVSHP
ncbi:hypothetical protein DFH06DRAFT_1325218 [Mycena polygramma]|nr:hypothetical protein DFH06DRAFT_1325218 [Mycena polygramma]